MNLNPLSWFKSASVANVATAVQADVAAAPAKAVSLVHAGLAALEKYEAKNPTVVALLEYLDSLNTKFGAVIMQDIDQSVLSAVVAEVPAAGPILEPLIQHPLPAAPTSTPSAAPTPAAKPAVTVAPVTTAGS